MLSENLKEAPLWNDDVPVMASPPVELPLSMDVLVIGSGYTGLNAALETSRGGLHTVVIDAGLPGHGCSTRNGGQISTSVKPSVKQLARRIGTVRAQAIRGEGATALQWIEQRIASERIDCDFIRSGRFHAAHTPKHYEQLLRDVQALKREHIDAYGVPRSEQRSELGTDAYHGGVVFPEHASLHPAKYHRGLLERVVEAGVTVVPDCAALSIERAGKAFRVTTRQGEIQAGQVIVATNGYTGPLTPWLRRRSIPIGSYVIATEELPESVIDELFPTNRIASDTCKVVYYYRASSDRKRVVFGGRVSAGDVPLTYSAERLHQQMCRLFPQLQSTKVSHSWSGKVSYSFDELTHTGTHDGIHYAMCYCGSGVSMASYLGMRLGQKVMGKKEGATAFDNLPFPTRPLYSGNPWFLPPVVAWYRWRDRVQIQRYATKN